MSAPHPHGSINNSYLVMLKNDVPSSVMQNHFNFLTVAHESDPLQLDGGVQSGIRHVYNGHIKGYSGMFTDGVVERIRGMPEVDYVERDQIVRTTSVATQRSAPWVSRHVCRHAQPI
jgi:cerevisin